MNNLKFAVCRFVDFVFGLLSLLLAGPDLVLLRLGVHQDLGLFLDVVSGDNIFIISTIIFIWRYEKKNYSGVNFQKISKPSLRSSDNPTKLRKEPLSVVFS